jgi:hypothetical protein
MRKLFASDTPRRDGTMARKRKRTPALSNDAADKMLACLNYPVGQLRSGSDYSSAPLYFDACWDWYQRLSSDHRDTVALVIDVWAYPDRRFVAERVAAYLPPAPKYPLS